MGLQFTVRAAKLTRTAKLADCIDAAKAATLIQSLNNYIAAEIVKGNVTSAPATVTIPSNTEVTDSSVLERIVLYFDYQKASGGETEHGQFTIFAPDETSAPKDANKYRAFDNASITAIMAAIKAACGYDTITFTTQRYLAKSRS